MNYLQGTTEHEIYTMLAAGFCERGEKPCGWACACLRAEGFY